MAHNASHQPSLCDALRVSLQRCSNAPHSQIELYLSVVDALAEHSYLLAGVAKQSWSSVIQHLHLEPRIGGLKSEPVEQVESGPDNALSYENGSDGSQGMMDMKRKRRRRRRRRRRAAQHRVEHGILRRGLESSVNHSTTQRQSACLHKLDYPRSPSSHNRIPHHERSKSKSEIQAQRFLKHEATVYGRHKALGLPPLSRKNTTSSAMPYPPMRRGQGARPSVGLVPSSNACLTPPPSPPWMLNSMRR
jgi:hypothetical protein